jgi:hypothetical protein
VASNAFEFHIVDIDGADVVWQTPGLAKEEWSKGIARRRSAESKGELDEVSAVLPSLLKDCAAIGGAIARGTMYRHAPEQVS